MFDVNDFTPILSWQNKAALMSTKDGFGVLR